MVTCRAQLKASGKGQAVWTAPIPGSFRSPAPSGPAEGSVSVSLSTDEKSISTAQI